jgi:gliding motility-associated-like protein
VRLIGSSEGQCIDTAYRTLIMNEVLDIWFTNNDSLCITGNNFNFDGSMKGSSTTTFNWDFGPNASVQSANSLDVNGVVFSKPGIIPITLTGNYANCVDKQTSTIFIYKEPEIDFDIAPGLKCSPFNAQFINFSTADSPLSYFWTFGEGGTSDIKNPSYIYDSVGVYDVSLTISASKGCTDTISMLKEDYIVVHPSPVSNFQTDKLITDICHSEIQFFDLSQEAKEVYYSFNGSAFSDLPNPIYSFTESGLVTPIQIATNEYFCTDTSKLSIYIEPFTVYIPNAFTPDGNAYNNLFRAITYLDVKEWEFTIYNRWGEVIFYSTDVNEGWDGFYKNKLAQDGLYNYQLRYVSCEKSNFTHELRGHFSLIK